MLTIDFTYFLYLCILFHFGLVTILRLVMLQNFKCLQIYENLILYQKVKCRNLKSTSAIKTLIDINVKLSNYYSL